MTYRSKVTWIFLLGFALDLVNMFVAPSPTQVLPKESPNKSPNVLKYA